jgi:hypothetical protein
MDLCAPRCLDQPVQPEAGLNRPWCGKGPALDHSGSL